LVLLLSTLGAVVTSLAAGKGFSFALLVSALKMGFTAAGGYATVKKIFSKKPDATKIIQLEAPPVPPG
jgi:hypothetical protein